jgi:excisionase family DNA binding protein
MTVGEVALMLRVHPMTIHRMIRRGHLSAIRVENQIRIPARSVQEYLVAREV